MTKTRAGKCYPLILYMRMVDRWWPPVFLLGLATMLLAIPFYRDVYIQLTEPWRWELMAGLGTGLILISIFMWIMRKSAFVRPFGDHLQLATPFLRLNISYQRIFRATSANMTILFPSKSLRGMRRDIFEPLSGMTAVVVELNAYPIPRFILRFFLSPFFFKDKTPHFVILVQDWMGFSTELESMRTSGTQPLQQKTPNQSILSKLSKK